MANTHETLTGLFTDIADAIRDKTGGTEPIVADAFPAAIGAIEIGGGPELEDALITRTLSEYSNDRVAIVGDYAFAGFGSLTTVNLPVATELGTCAFEGCSSLRTVVAPKVKTLMGGAFKDCQTLATIKLPSVTRTLAANAFYGCVSLRDVYMPLLGILSDQTFYSCRSLRELSLPSASVIRSSAFWRCHNLSSIYLGLSSVCRLVSSNAFSSTPYGGYSKSYSGTPAIYVPASLLASYKTASNWSYFSSYFVGI